ncbi:MAG TPA: UDP-N-acetylglucosamine 2-epimerase (non-hydrolyzing) [Candidatus Krumholzibacteria bacterium]|nr:UDP-N-acetylglucosamine 2-epimerase (non-hydrolyzing) [Candidatus Krumholzibacteria bacterium]HPD70787.1 UDP-N-acetylglucosamine 2-epimerase (non-hydrolyzing) [Candidatus Krumholzibacteria bacterium]HRY39513.1 UDP-N-acetylglucosamine 2-epimerase (non-hydrolyzing) [Candidatus Krumholzibacteria bacterium]
MPAKILLVAAARPNFMKIAPLWRALAARPDAFAPLLVHTGQHYDQNMSAVFFADLGLPAPDVHLGVGSGTHAEQTAGVMLRFEAACREHRPACVIVVGDVNATMAAAIAAKKLLLDVAHVEAGLRSGDRTMPEEINRVLTDCIADVLFTPSPDADGNLLREGVDASRIARVGNIMIDSLVHALARVRDRACHDRFGLGAGEYGLVTLHRPANVDEPALLRRLFDGLRALDYPLIFPVHPRTRKVMAAAGLARLFTEGGPLRLCDPLGYDDFLNLTVHARFVITDSGGIQEETTYLGIPCLTMRPNTERPVTITEGTNELATLATLPGQVQTIRAGNWKRGRVPDLWDGRTAERIAEVLQARYA